MMKSSLLACAFALTATMLSSAAYSASPVSVGPFRSVELRGGGHVILRPGAVQRVTLVDGSTQFTKFYVKSDGQLVIDTCDENCPRHYDLEVEIVTPRIEGVAISGGGEVESESGFGRQNSIGLPSRAAGISMYVPSMQTTRRRQSMAAGILLCAPRGVSRLPLTAEATSPIGEIRL